MDLLLSDLRFAVRTLVKAPVFTVVAVLSLALGIGANATIFTVVNAVFLSALPVERPQELVAVYTVDANTPGGFGGLLQVSYPNYKDLRDRSDVFTDVAGYTPPFGASVATDGEPAPVTVELVTGSYFGTLGVRPVLGRPIGADDDLVPGGHPVAVLSYGYWQRHLGGDHGVTSRTVKVNGIPFTVLGVMPEGFKGVNALFSPDLWVPVTMYARILPAQFRSWMDERRALAVNMAARLRPGVGAGQADSQLAALGRALEEEFPIPNKGRSFVTRPLTQATIFPGVRTAFVLGSVVLMVVVGLVLLIACTNVANLLIARATGRQQELAVRVALGAGRRRLVRQLLTESLVLALAGGVVGLLFASLARDYLWSLRPPFLAQNFVELGIDSRVLTFTFAVALATAVVFGLLPALQASRVDVVGTLKEESRGSGLSQRRRRLGRALVMGQVALSVVALVVAGLFLRSLAAGNRIDTGFTPEGLVTAFVNTGQAAYEQGRAESFLRQVDERVDALPGVQSVAWADTAPLTGAFFRTVVAAGREDDAERRFAAATNVSPGYFSTLGIRLQAGRDFTEADREGSPRVAIVNDTLAARLWPGESAVGKRFRFFEPDSYHEVVGVVSTVKINFIGEDPQMAAYVPLEQNFVDGRAIFVRASGDPAAALGSIQQVIRSIDAQVPIANPSTMQQVIGQSLWPARMAAILLGALGGLALALAAVGLYGLMAYSVSQRRHEIGLRMALGAESRLVIRDVLADGLVTVGAGLGIGLAVSLGVSRFVGGLLYGVSPTDPVTFVGVMALLVAVALTASLVPALRASRVDPVVALR
jgi:predicted permease